MSRIQKFLNVISVLLYITLTGSALAQNFSKHSLQPNHPLVGKWRVNYPDLNCYQEIAINSNGTYTWNSSSGEYIVSDFNISDQPEDGFYQFKKSTTSVNGRPDCFGRIAKVGQELSFFIRLHPSGKGFLFCVKPSLNLCFEEMLSMGK